MRKQHRVAGCAQQEVLHQAALILPQLLHQLRQEERHLHSVQSSDNGKAATGDRPLVCNLVHKSLCWEDKYCITNVGTLSCWWSAAVVTMPSAHAHERFTERACNDQAAIAEAERLPPREWTPW